MRKLTLLTGLSTLLMLNVAYAGSGKGDSRGGLYDYAQVVQVQPIVRKIQVSTPVRECWEENEVRTVSSQPGVSGSAIVGGIIGGLIGNQMGQGHGRTAMTVMGVALGSTVGQAASRQGAAQAETVSYPVQRCQTRENISYQERVDGYQVTYKYHGQTYRTRMPYDPGKKVKVRVEVRPVD
jgi:uncharacterized protein YcfJ